MSFLDDVSLQTAECCQSQDYRAWRAAEAEVAKKIVKTQGTDLMSPCHTPVWKQDETAFVESLSRKLRILARVGQAVRRAKYGPAADEWPIGRTPSPVVLKRKRELEALLEQDSSTPDISACPTPTRTASDVAADTSTGSVCMPETIPQITGRDQAQANDIALDNTVRAQESRPTKKRRIGDTSK
ncbi:hypothetical protein ABW21_db0202524 [Orbilia brochopaga]|nr:hypothetical protein ABW21_db0202524 [Drechslerella brochopaga]